MKDFSLLPNKLSVASEISRWELYTIYMSVRATRQAQLMAGSGRCRGAQGVTSTTSGQAPTGQGTGSGRRVLLVPPNYQEKFIMKLYSLLPGSEVIYIQRWSHLSRAPLFPQGMATCSHEAHGM